MMTRGGLSPDQTDQLKQTLRFKRLNAYNDAHPDDIHAYCMKQPVSAKIEALRRVKRVNKGPAIALAIPIEAVYKRPGKWKHRRGGQPGKVRHCSRCGEAGHYSTTCNRRLREIVV